jgi:hypothetical protein
MGRLSKYEAASSQLAEELEALVALVTTMRKAIEDSKERVDGLAVRQLTDVLSNVIKIKLAYDRANKSEAESLTPAQEQAVIIDWVCGMASATRARFMAKLTAALAGEEVPED